MFLLKINLILPSGERLVWSISGPVSGDSMGPLDRVHLYLNLVP